MNIINKILNRLISKSHWYNNVLFGGVTKFWGNLPFNLDVINLGSSSAYHAFKYELCDIKAANWAIAPQSLQHDFNILKNYFSYLKNGAYVIISICPFSCLKTNYSSYHNFRYYTILHPATIDNFDDNERSRAYKYKVDPFGYYPILCLKYLIKDIIRKVWKCVTFSNSNKTDLKVSADELLNSWKNQFEIQDLNSPIHERHKEDFLYRRKTLQDMIKFCNDRNLNPVLVIPPMYNSLREQFPESFWKEYVSDFITDLSVPVYDCSRDPAFTSHPEYFSSALFLNSKGALRFTQMLINKIFNQ